MKLGVHPAIHRWIRNFLNNRVQCQQCVEIQSSSCSSWKRMNGGLPQRTKLGPLLFAILVNNLLKNWHGRIKFVDDMTVFEIIPRGSPSRRPLLIDEISNFASIRGMQLNPRGGVVTIPACTARMGGLLHIIDLSASSRRSWNASFRGKQNKTINHCE